MLTRKYNGRPPGRVKLFLILLILISSCKQETYSKKNTELPIKNNVIEKVSNNNAEQVTKILSKDLYLDESDDLFSNWRIPNDDIIMNLITKMDTISNYELNMCYADFKCGVRGELMYHGKEYNFNFNSGGWLQLKNPIENIILGSKNKSDTLNIFISVYYCDEEWD